MTTGDKEFMRCLLLRDHGKAYLVKLMHNDREVWIPKSLCSLREKEEIKPELILEVESWFASNESLNER